MFTKDLFETQIARHGTEFNIHTFHHFDGGNVNTSLTI